MKKFNVGDIVWSDRYGKGQIIEIPGYTQMRETAFVSAVFYNDGAVIVFTADGKESPEEGITLHHFEEEEQIELNFKPFEKVLIVGNDSKYYPGFFAYYVKRDAKYFCCIIGTNIFVPLEDVIPYKGNENLVTHILEDF